jgi:uncharacterized protein YheU (UPF0270 family)
MRSPVRLPDGASHLAAPDKMATSLAPLRSEQPGSKMIADNDPELRMTIVPYDRLDPDILDALVEEFVTREGAVQGHTDTPTSQKAAAVLRQLKSGIAVIVFDEVIASCTIMPKDNLPADSSEPSSDPWGLRAGDDGDPCDS